MTKIKKIFPLIFAVFVGILLTSCQREKGFDISVPKKVAGSLSIRHQVSSKLTDSLLYIFEDSLSKEQIKMKSFRLKDYLTSTLYYSNGSNWIELTTIRVDIQQGRFRKSMHRLIKNEAERLKSQMGKVNVNIAKLEMLTNILNQIPAAMVKRLGKEQYGKETSLSIFYHMGVINSLIRSLKQNTKTCNCEINKSYINSESPFYCNEDKLVKADEIREIVEKISNKQKFFGKKFYPEKMILYLIENSGKLLPVSIVDDIFRQETRHFWNTELTENERSKLLAKNNSLNSQSHATISTSSEETEVALFDCIIMGVTSGNECGCCGNYSGTCWFCSFACLAHDIACETCTPEWFCLSGCVPGPC